jgi:hypothetical protein
VTKNVYFALLATLCEQKHGRSLLHAASQAGLVEVVRAILDADADVHQLDVRVVALLAQGIECSVWHKVAGVVTFCYVCDRRACIRW